MSPASERFPCRQSCVTLGCRVASPGFRNVLSGATVTATNEGNGEKHRVTSNSNGYYVLPNLFVGSYSVEVEAPGFKKSVQSGIQLSAAAKLSIDIELTVGAVSDSVEVSASATLVQSETATVGRTVEAKQIENLTAQLKEQASQIQKVSAQLETSKPAPQMVINNP